MSREATQATWLGLIERHSILITLAEEMDRGGTVRAEGRAGCSSVATLAALHRQKADEVKLIRGQTTRRQRHH